MATKTRYAKYASSSRKRALDKVGTSYPAGWCLKFQLLEIFGVPGIGDWDGDGSADAEDYAKAVDRAGHLHRPKSPDEIPAGALVLWTGGRNDHGHAAYSLGDGEIVTTDLPKSGRIGRTPVTDIATKWGLKLAGWTTATPDGVQLVKATASKPSKPKATRYLVTARSGLRGRTGPTTLSKAVTVRRYGQAVEAVTTATGGGYTWAVDAEGIHYATRYLKAA